MEHPEQDCGDVLYQMVKLAFAKSILLGTRTL